MERLLEIDKKDYTEDCILTTRYCVRAIILKDGKVAMQKGAEGDYKILGGGKEPDEEIAPALMREVEEESGLKIIPESIRELGEIFEKRRDLYDPALIYTCYTWFYACEVSHEAGQINMTPSEIRKGYHLVWASPEEIVEGNRNFLHQPWIYRDTEFIRRYFGLS